MKVWRIANAKYTDLNGIGGLSHSGRWHKVGKPIIYTADHQALSAMEILVHMDMEMKDLPDYVLLEIDVPNEVLILEDETEPTEAITCKHIGDKWLLDKTSAILKVKTVLMPSASNYLINPLHPDAGKITITHQEPFYFDERLFK